MAELTGREIVAIIKALSVSKVVNLEYGTLKLTKLPDDTEISPPAHLTNTSNDPESELIDRNLQQDLSDYQLNVEDPLAFEQQIILGDLSDEKV